MLILIESPNGACFEIGGYNMLYGCDTTADYPAGWNSSSAGVYTATFDAGGELLEAGNWTISVMNGWSASPESVNYDLELVLEGPCALPDVIPGCLDPNACNFDPEATLNDNTCEYQSCANGGCTYASANNFDLDATYDDGSCTFTNDCVNPCPSDITGDGLVSTTDLLALLADFGDLCE